MNWRRKFRSHDPLTQRLHRTTADADGDPFSWWEGPQPGDRDSHWLIDSFCWAVAAVLFALMLTSPTLWSLLK